MPAHPWTALTALTLVACQPSAPPPGVSTPAAPLSQTIPSTLPATAPSTKTKRPHTLKLSLKLDRPENLQVQAGQTVTKGQVISNRPSEREPLHTERRALLNQLEQLNTQPPSPAATATEEAELNYSALKVQRLGNGLKVLFLSGLKS